MQIQAIYFSPTGTTEKLVTSFAEAIPNSEVQYINITGVKAREEVTADCKADLIILGVPVYAGLAPKLAIDYIKRLRGNDTRVVILSAYGNRSAGSTCRQIASLVTENGFIPVAAADFIGEHSFSDQDYPIGPGRPDIEDLLLVQKFARKIPEIMSRRSARLDLALLGGTPGESQDIFFEPPIVTDLCNNCGECLSVCPVDIISTNQRECIACAACVRACEQKARVFTEKVNLFQRKLSKACQVRQEPRIYI